MSNLSQKHHVAETGASTLPDSDIENQRVYRDIFKATSLFGGVQVYNIGISIVRMKIIALLLGTSGLGMLGLYSASVTLMSNLTSFGLQLSAVKNVASAHATGQSEKIATVVMVLKRLVWITGAFGTLFMLLLSPILSRLSFGNYDYTIPYAVLSVMLLFAQLGAGQNVVLQGLRKLNHLAQANLIGASLGLLVSLPIYYFLREDGIVPSLILTAFISLVMSWYFARRIPLKRTSIDFRTIMSEGSELLSMGIMLSMSNIITTGTAYTMRIFIGNIGGMTQVGLYTAGFALINTYVGMIFTAMSTDYYPRLSGISHDNQQMTKLVNKQIEIALLMIAPVVNVLIIFVDLVLLFLYSGDFLVIDRMIQWFALGMYFKTLSWGIAFTILAKGESVVFFRTELSVQLYLLGFTFAGYIVGGLSGLGIAFLSTYIVYFLQVYFLARRRYAFRFEASVYRHFVAHVLMSIGCFIITIGFQHPWSYASGMIPISLSIAYTSYEMNKRLDFSSAFRAVVDRL